MREFIRPSTPLFCKFCLEIAHHHFWWQTFFFFFGWLCLIKLLNTLCNILYDGKQKQKASKIFYPGNRMWSEVPIVGRILISNKWFQNHIFIYKQIKQWRHSVCYARQSSTKQENLHSLYTLPISKNVDIYRFYMYGHPLHPYTPKVRIYLILAF